jgi:hypothetical protein
MPERWVDRNIKVSSDGDDGVYVSIVGETPASAKLDGSLHRTSFELTRREFESFVKAGKLALSMAGQVTNTTVQLEPENGIRVYPA